MSHVVVFGFSGYAGGAITAELVARGHRVTGVSRTPSTEAPNVEVRAGSIFDADFVREVTRDADQIVVALHASGEPALITALPHLTEAAIAAGARLSFVGGAGSLLVAAGGPRLFDTPDFPEEYLGEARGHGAILDALRESTDELDWFYVSPAATFGAWNAGERTGEFRIGGDVMLTDANGESAISGADYAIAYVDEIEQGAHHRARFGVAY